MSPRPPREVVIGVDVGTTAVKVVAFHPGSTERQSAVREYPLVRPAPGWRVQDPELVVDATLAALREVVDQVECGRVTGLSLSAAMHGLIALDHRGDPLTPLVTWADGRAVEEARWLRTDGYASDLHRATGVPVHPMTPLTKLMWFARHEPTLCADARWWVGLKDFLIFRLTGILGTELSSAGGTGLLDLYGGGWHREALDLAGVSADQLPPIFSPTDVLPLLPEAAERTGLPSRTPVVLGAADGPLGNLGSGAMGRGEAGLSLGTSGAVRMIVREPTLDAHGRLFCYPLTEDLWVTGGAVSNGGAVMRWAAGVFGQDAKGEPLSDPALLELATDVPPGSDGVVMLPFLLPERAPLWDPELTGAFLGLRHSHTRGHFVRAAMEGVALQLSTVVDLLDRLEPVTSLRVTGGSFRAPLWREIVAAVIDRPTYAVGGAEGTALGAAALGLLALHRAEDLRSAVTALGAGRSSEQIAVDPGLAMTYGRHRAAVSDLLRSQEAVADLLTDSASRVRA